MSQTYDLGIRITADGRILTAEVKRSQESVQALGDTAQQVGAQTAAALGNIGKSAETLNTTLNRTGVSAAQTAAALRMVPAQVTDIVTGLASGQAPLTVLIQQGGQLKDAFGGVVPAAKALGGYVAGLASPLTIGAAVAAALGYALYSASSEADEFKRNLILTGNASGLTVDRFNQVTASLDNLSGVTRGAAAEALTTMAASGNIGAESIERLTTAALKMEHAGGPAVAETVKQFEALGKSPAEASLKLNEQTRHLTLAVYEQIKALEAQGKASEAGALAQQAWADAIEQRTPQMLENLGYLQRAWRGIKEGVAEAVDAAKEWGRAETKVEQAIRLQTRIGNIDDSLKDPTRAYEWNRLRQIRQQLKTELDGINADINKAQSAAATAAATAARDQAQLAANVAADKLIEGQRSKREKHARELKLLDEQRAKELLSEEKYQQAKAALAKQYEEKERAPRGPKRSEAEREQERLNGLLEKGSGVSKTYSADVQLLARALGAGKITTEQYAGAAKELWLTQTKAGKTWLEHQAAVEQASVAQKAWVNGHKMQLEQIDAETAAIGQSTEARKIALAVQQVKSDTEKQIAALSTKLSEEERLAAEKEIRQEGDKQQAALKTALIKQQALAGAYQLEQENRRFAAESIFDEQARAQAILDIDAETWRQRIALAAEGSAERQRLEAAFLQWYANQMSKPAIEATRHLIDNMDRTFHDGFVNMLEQGKADWDAFGKSLANTFKATVADEIYKMTVKPIVVNVLGAFAGGAANAAGAATAQGAGGAQQGLGIVSGVSGAWTAFNGGMSGMATSFANSGLGQYLGLSTAPGLVSTETALGTLQVQTAGGLTSAGSSMAAAAGPVAAALAAAYTIAEMNKAGWGSENNRRGYATDLMFRGGIGTAVITDRLFGHNRKVSDDAAGIQGTIDLAGFSGQNYQEKSQKGGTFRSDRRWTDTSAVESDMDAYMDSLVRQTVSGVQAVGKALGLETENAIQGFSHSFQLQLTENGSWDKAGEKMAAELGKVGDELATRLLPNIEAFSRYGESATQTLTRLNAEFKGTDAILQMLGKTAQEAFGAAGLESASARERLIDIAGGMDQLAAKTASYYQHFYTEEERAQAAATAAREQLNTAFAEAGEAVPASLAAFRALVKEQDLSTEAGARRFNRLMDLEGLFYTIAESATAAEKSSRSQQSGLIDRYTSDAQKVAQAQQQLTAAFGAYGMTVPKTRADILALAQAQDPLTESGQKAIAALDKITGAFDIVTASANTAADKQISAMQRVTAQMDQVTSYKAGISSAQLDIRSKLPSFDAVGYYSQQGNDLRKQLSAASTVEQRLGVGEQLKTSILNRYQAEQDAIAKTREAAKTDFDKRRQDAQELLKLQQQGAQTAQQSARQWNDAMLRLREYANGLLLSDASTLSPEAKLAEAERQYNAMLQRAKGGDADAAGQLQGNAQAYLAAARDYYASGTGYAAIFDQVQSGVAGLGSRAQSAASLDAAFQQQSLSYQTQSLALDTQWQQMWADQSNTWQQEDAELAQKTIDELDTLQQQADAWNEELKQQLQEQALNGVRQTELLGDVARNTENLDTRIGAAIAGAMSALQAQVNALTNIQAKASSDMVSLQEQNNDLLYSIERISRMEAL